METDAQISPPSQDAIESAKALYHTIQKVLPEAVTDFESKWTAWQEVCQGQTSSTTLDACTRTDEFEALKRLGPKILPFVVSKLATNAGRNYYGVFLYNTMEKDAQYRGSPDEPVVDEEVLRRHGGQIVELNYQRHKIYRERLRLWKEYCDLYLVVANFSICCEGSDEYFDLVEMGPSIITPLMVEYMNYQGMYWYEVLHKIVHGRNMGAHTVWRDALYDGWYQFFNGGADYDQPPKYIPNEWDEFFLNHKVSPRVREYFRQMGREL